MPANTDTQSFNIPSMGGDRLKPFFDRVVVDLPENTAVVEVGTWLGAGTAQIASALRHSGLDEMIAIHCFDRWIASKSEALKASKAGLNMREGDDTLPLVKSMLSPLNSSIHFHKGDLIETEWDNGLISLYIDDAAKNPELFYHVLRTFGPSWIPGKTILILMDFYYWKKEKGRKSRIHRCQQDFIEQYPDHFEIIKDFKSQYQTPFSNEAFVYKKAIDFSALERPVYSLSYSEWARSFVHSGLGYLSRKTRKMFGAKI